MGSLHGQVVLTLMIDTNENTMVVLEMFTIYTCYTEMTGFATHSTLYIANISISHGSTIENSSSNHYWQHTVPILCIYYNYLIHLCNATVPTPSPYVSTYTQTYILSQRRIDYSYINPAIFNIKY